MCSRRGAGPAHAGDVSIELAKARRSTRASLAEVDRAAWSPGYESLSASQLVDDDDGCCARMPCLGALWEKLRPRSNFYKTFVPNLDPRVLKLTRWQRRMIKTQYVTYVAQLDKTAMSSRQVLRRMRTTLILGTVLVSGVSMVQKVTYIEQDPQLVFVFFWILISLAIANMIVSTFMSDLKMLETATVNFRAATLLRVRGGMFLARVQDYTSYKDCGQAFRHFMRDVLLMRLKIMESEIRNMASNPDESSVERVPRDNTLPTWAALSDPQIIPVTMDPVDPSAVAMTMASPEMMARSTSTTLRRRSPAMPTTVPTMRGADWRAGGADGGIVGAPRGSLAATSSIAAHMHTAAQRAKQHLEAAQQRQQQREATASPGGAGGDGGASDVDSDVDSDAGSSSNRGEHGSALALATAEGDAGKDGGGDVLT